jgi:hypothetical protein
VQPAQHPDPPGLLFCIAHSMKSKGLLPNRPID